MLGMWFDSRSVAVDVRCFASTRRFRLYLIRYVPPPVQDPHPIWNHWTDVWFPPDRSWPSFVRSDHLQDQMIILKCYPNISIIATHIYGEALTALECVDPYYIQLLNVITYKWRLCPCPTCCCPADVTRAAPVAAVAVPAPPAAAPPMSFILPPLLPPRRRCCCPCLTCAAPVAAVAVPAPPAAAPTAAIAVAPAAVATVAPAAIPAAPGAALHRYHPCCPCCCRPVAAARLPLPHQCHSCCPGYRRRCSRWKEPLHVQIFTLLRNWGE